LRFGVCLDGENAWPPDDVGGTNVYSEFVEAVTDPEHEEHDRMVQWADGPFDPSEFDLAKANALMQKVR
jgi:hypothetical protein